MEAAFSGRRAMGLAALIASLLVGNYAQAQDLPAQPTPRVRIDVQGGVDIVGLTSIRPAFVRSSDQVKAARLLQQATTAIEQAGTHGLNPSHYEIANLRELLRELSGEIVDRSMWPKGFRSAQRLAHRSLLGYGLDLKFGQAPTSDADIAALRDTLDAAISENSVASWIESLLPKHSAYQQLQARLGELEEVRIMGGWLAVESGPTLEPGSSGERVERLRTRLGLDADTPTPDIYDDTLRQAVEDYQSTHGLEADGIAGRRTLRHLDVSIEARIEQLKANLKRWRQMPVPDAGTYVHVNIPDYKLEFVRAGQANLSMRVIVGGKRNQTPIFSDSIEYLVFKPYWHVPRSITVRELLPKIAADRDYLIREGFEIVGSDGVVSPESIDFTQLDAANFPYRLRQRPGSKNSLGLVKFIFPNDFSVYLHDTPADSLFTRSRRALSHGCVRVEYPEQLATAILDGMPAWSGERVQSAMHGNRPDYVALNEPVPVFITYLTAASTEDGKVRFFDDVYGRDRQGNEPFASERLAPLPDTQPLKLAAVSLTE